MSAVVGRRALQRRGEDRASVRSCGYGEVDGSCRWISALAYLDGNWWRRVVGVERCEFGRDDYWQC